MHKFICSCGSKVFRYFFSRNKAICHECMKEYTIDEVMGKIEIKHQRG